MIGQVQWDMAAGADYYVVRAVTEQGLTVSCVTDDTNCAMYSLGCGQMYTVNVTANNRACQNVSTSTDSAAIATGEKTPRTALFLTVSGLSLLLSCWSRHC